MPRSDRSRFKLQATAALTSAQPLFVMLALGTIIAATVQRSGAMLESGFQAAGFAVLVALLRWSVGRNARCPLCGTPVMGGAKCVRHRMARRLLGSHSLRVAAHIALRGQFVCPYCNETTAMLSSEQAKEFSSRRRKREKTVLSPERDVWKDL